MQYLIFIFPILLSRSIIDFILIQIISDNIINGLIIVAIFSEN